MSFSHVYLGGQRSSDTARAIRSTPSVNVAMSVAIESLK
jgi:hypothetical protein